MRKGHPSGGLFLPAMGLGRAFWFARFSGKLYYRAQSGISSLRPAAFRRDISGDFVPASYKIDKARRFVLSTGTGFLSKEDVLGHMDRISADPEFDPTFSQLLDFTNVAEVGFGPDDVRQFAERNIFSPGSRRAFVVQNDLHFGLARMFEIHRELRGETGIAVFRSMEEAMDWIAVGNLAS
jgi:hypothetical protein